ncbi:DUF4340 domain-containing protein [Lacrimispora sp.]|uniref:DUF4340 domain-containing protein n=1 Tax=Lacrimispora sp. TaxID=2719234 RepID=UPI00289877BF|nr:DUF4340 domain-containing protein [Lacrimispora sp.]
MKKKRGLLYGTAALAVLCVVYMGVGQYMNRSQEQAKEKKGGDIIHLTDLTNVSSLSYDFDGKELSFTKKDGKWNYDGDELFPVKQAEVDALASTVSKLEALRKLEGGDSLSAYGLDQPIRRIAATAEDGTRSVILLGNAAGDEDYYAALEGQDTPYLISATLYNETNTGLNDLMALEEFPAVSGADIKSITITKADSSEHFVKKKLDDKDGSIEWYRDSVDLPDNKVSNNSGLNVLADSLSSLKVKSCPNYKVQENELAGYGLDQPSAVITYTYDKNGSEETFTLSIGSLNSDSTCYYTRTENSSNINEIEKASIDKCLTVDKGIS